MNFEKFISSLSIEIKNPLPGKVSQLKMSPNIRFEQHKLPKENKAGVLILLFTEMNTIKMLFIKRKTYNGVHSGQISLPGGRMEDRDSSLQSTALREAEEEVGIKKESIIILGKLSQIYIGPSNYDVHPFIGYVNAMPIFKANPDEVKYLIKVSLQKLCSDNTKETKNMLLNGQYIKVPYYNINGEHIWGATAMIISEFLDVIKRFERFRD